MTRPDISALIEQTHSETLAHQVAKYALELEADRSAEQWLEANPGRVKAIRGFDLRKPDKWSWCWGDGKSWHEAFTLRSAIDAAREAA